MPSHQRPGFVPDGDFPFSVRRWPFFYGWVVWLFSGIGFLMSVPGQTMGMAVYTDTFIDQLGLTRTELSLAYLFGTLSSSLFLTRAGRWFDVWGARVLIVGASVLLGAVLLYISVLDVVLDAASSWVGVTPASLGFVLILLGYFGVRFLGQGVLTSASRNVLLVWFDRRRGMVSGIRGVLTTLGFSLAPLLLAMLIDTFGWRGSLWMMALALAVVFAGLAFVFLRDTPESCGLVPDGGPGKSSEHPHRRPMPDRTFAEARRDPIFWIYSVPLSIYSMVGTAVVFHIVAIFEEAGRGRDEAFAYFFPQAIVATSVNLLASWLSDRHRLKPYLIAMLTAYVIGAIGLIQLDRDWGYWAMIVGLGAGSGLWQVVSNLGFIRFFGRLHLGEVSGMNTAMSVFASAIGPAFFSLGYDLFGTYRAPSAVSLALLAIALAAAVWLRQEEPVPRAVRDRIPEAGDTGSRDSDQIGRSDSE